VELLGSRQVKRRKRIVPNVPPLRSVPIVPNVLVVTPFNGSKVQLFNGKNRDSFKVFKPFNRVAPFKTLFILRPVPNVPPLRSVPVVPIVSRFKKRKLILREPRNTRPAALFALAVRGQETLWSVTIPVDATPRIITRRQERAIERVDVQR
jgi:hypothetical protein